ncbi:MAG: hypothetical protein CL927_16155 [Deltaproteobacteria bacterium]|nr:hypothetical protein [Deltaproteobacteria bacterium]HCH66049.1 hypothetical protein [Deltaproteobacteria bacterium]
MPATANKLLPTSLDILRNALQRGSTGRLFRTNRHMPSREVYVMQGEILAAHGPDDGPWIVRRLVNSGALTERQGKAFIRRLTRGIPFDELILGHVPDGLLEQLMAGRFRQNLLDFLSSPPPIDFQPMEAMFVPNLQAGHDTSRTLQAVVELRQRIGPLIRHRGPLTLCLGPSMPNTRQEARLVDLCDPPMPLRDLLTYSPFETGETLDIVMKLLSNGAVVSQEGVRLQQPRGSGPTADYAVEDLFSLDEPAEPEPLGLPADPIVPEHLALLREDTETDGAQDFGSIPRAFETLATPTEEAELPSLNESHLVLVPEGDSTPAASEGSDVASAATSPSDAAPKGAVPPNASAPSARAPESGSFDPAVSPPPIVQEGDLSDNIGRLDASEASQLSQAPLGTDTAAAQPPPKAPSPTEASPGVDGGASRAPPPDEDSMPESWRDLSPLGFEEPATSMVEYDDETPVTGTISPEASAPPARAEVHDADEASEANEAADASGVDEADHADGADETAQTDRVDEAEEADPTQSPVHASVRAPAPPLVPPTVPKQASHGAAPVVQSPPPVAQPSATTLARTPSVDAFEPPNRDDLLAAVPSVTDLPPAPAKLQALAEESTPVPAPASVVPVANIPIVEAPSARVPAPSAALAGVDLDHQVGDDIWDELDEAAADDAPEATTQLTSSSNDTPLEERSTDTSDGDLLEAAAPKGIEEPPLEAVHADVEDSIESLGPASSDGAPETKASLSDSPSTESEPPPTSSDSDTDGPDNALLDAARRYLEAANTRRQTKPTKAPRSEPEVVEPIGVERKFTGFDFDVEDAEMAMFEDHDRYRGGGGGQFTLNKNLLDKVELLPSARPDRVRTREPEALEPEDSIIEMGEATPEEEAEAGVVALAFSAPTLDADQVFYKISVAGDVARAIAIHFDAAVGPGAGQTNIQLLVDAAASPFARLFHQVRVASDGSLDEEKIFENLQQRPTAEHRSLLDRGMRDFIERALSTAAEELPDDALDHVLNEIAGYQQRLRM